LMLWCWEGKDSICYVFDQYS